MPLIDRLGGELPRGPVTVELDDIQATVLRYRPEPYYGTKTPTPARPGEKAIMPVGHTTYG